MVSAKDVPALVAAHQDYLGNVDYARFAGFFMRSLFTKSSSWDAYDVIARKNGTSVADIAYRTGEAWAGEEREMLYDVPLYHVSTAMAEVAKYAAIGLPSTERWSAESLPSMEGFLVFESPLRIHDVWGRPSGIAAISWRRQVDENGMAGWASHQTEEFGDDRMVTTMMMYADVNDKLDAYSVEIAKQGLSAPGIGRWACSHYEGIVDGARIGPMEFTDAEDFVRRYREKNAKIDMDLHKDPEFQAVHRALHPEDFDSDGRMLDENDPIPEQSMPGENTERIIYAIFALMEQKVAQKDVYTDKRHARRMRHKKRGTPPMVTVITLRREEEWGYHEEGTGNWLMYRSIVKAHWRLQHYGDGTAKKIWIHKYWRGSSDLPIHQPKRVSSLTR